MPKISKIYSREILDSRGIPTLETAVVLDNNITGVASVPSGASTGTQEAVELRDEDPTKFAGKGVLKAINNVVNVIGPKVIGQEVTNQVQIDKLMVEADGSRNKQNLGANAILSVSLAVMRAGAATQGASLYKYTTSLANSLGLAPLTAYKIPTPIFNMINGGLHGAGNLDFQEFHVIPPTSATFSWGLQIGATIYYLLRTGLERRGAIHSVGDEGGFAPNLFTNLDALTIIVETIKESGLVLGRDAFLGLDVAATTFFRDNKYHIKDRSAPMDKDTFLQFYAQLNEQFHLALLEDPLEENDFEGWSQLVTTFAGNMLIVGDDLLVTNPERVQKAIEQKSCNAILVKPNQIGTISETLNVVKLAKAAGWRVIVSHRSGETNDTSIADFAVGIGADFVKFGAPARGERVAKYNRLLAIESELGLAK